MDITQILNQMQTSDKYVPPMSAYKLGRAIYKAGLPFESRFSRICSQILASWLVYF